MRQRDINRYWQQILQSRQDLEDLPPEELQSLYNLFIKQFNAPEDVNYELRTSDSSFESSPEISENTDQQEPDLEENQPLSVLRSAIQRDYSESPKETKAIETKPKSDLINLLDNNNKLPDTEQKPPPPPVVETIVKRKRGRPSLHEKLTKLNVEKNQSNSVSVKVNSIPQTSTSAGHQENVERKLRTYTRKRKPKEDQIYGGVKEAHTPPDALNLIRILSNKKATEEEEEADQKKKKGDISINSSIDLSSTSIVTTEQHEQEEEEEINIETISNCSSTQWKNINNNNNINMETIFNDDDDMDIDEDLRYDMQKGISLPDLFSDDTNIYNHVDANGLMEELDTCMNNYTVPHESPPPTQPPPPNATQDSNNNKDTRNQLAEEETLENHVNSRGESPPDNGDNSTCTMNTPNTNNNNNANSNHNDNTKTLLELDADIDNQLNYDDDDDDDDVLSMTASLDGFDDENIGDQVQQQQVKMKSPKPQQKKEPIEIIDFKKLPKIQKKKSLHDKDVLAKQPQVMRDLYEKSIIPLPDLPTNNRRAPAAVKNIRVQQIAPPQQQQQLPAELSTPATAPPILFGLIQPPPAPKQQQQEFLRQLRTVPPPPIVNNNRRSIHVSSVPIQQQPVFAPPYRVPPPPIVQAPQNIVAFTNATQHWLHNVFGIKCFLAFDNVCNQLNCNHDLNDPGLVTKSLHDLSSSKLFEAYKFATRNAVIYKMFFRSFLFVFTGRKLLKHLINMLQEFRYYQDITAEHVTTVYNEIVQLGMDRNELTALVMKYLWSPDTAVRYPAFCTAILDIIAKSNWHFYANELNSLFNEYKFHIPMNFLQTIVQDAVQNNDAHKAQLLLNMVLYYPLDANGPATYVMKSLSQHGCRLVGGMNSVNYSDLPTPHHHTQVMSSNGGGVGVGFGLSYNTMQPPSQPPPPPVSFQQPHQLPTTGGGGGGIVTESTPVFIPYQVEPRQDNIFDEIQSQFFG